MNSARTNCATTANVGEDSSIAGVRRRATFASVPLAGLLALLVLVSLQEARERPIARWQDHLHEAEAAMRAGDLYSARSLYAQTARIASWSDDWIGVLAAACGLKRLEKQRNDYFATRTALVRAMIAAERQRSAAGLNAVANAFAGIGEHKAAAMVRSRIPVDAPAGAQSPGQLWNCQ
jgi:hypothetical protein